MKVKVCGIRSYEDACLAIEAGADALGFILFTGSQRYIAPVEVRSIIRRLPPLIATVGVFVNVPDPSELGRIALSAGVSVVQLHGDETPDYCRLIGSWPVIKAFAPVAGGEAPLYSDYDVQALLLDSRSDCQYGGSGKPFDWGLIREIPRLKPVILAGGLHAGNVAEAIRAVRPYAVDVCSGVEYAPGRKDPVRLREFINEVRNAQ
jgi:phosphoribosylanthranilate isomerase